MQRVDAYAEMLRRPAGVELAVHVRARAALEVRAEPLGEQLERRVVERLDER